MESHTNINTHTHDEDNKGYDLMFGDYNIFILCTYKSHPPVRHKSPNETNEWFTIKKEILTLLRD